MNVDIRKTDVELLESLCDAAMRSGDTQTAIKGYALALRLRANLPGEAEKADAWRIVCNEMREALGREPI